MAATIVSMAAKSTYLEDQTSVANLQMEGHVGMPSQSQKDPVEMGASGSSPPTCHLGLWPEGHCLAILILGTTWEYM